MENTDTDILTSTLVTLVSGIKSKGTATDEQILAAVSAACKSHFIPCEAFADRKLGPLESAVMHLKDKQGLTFHQIAVILNRDDRTIWTSYRKAREKVTA